MKTAMTYDVQFLRHVTSNKTYDVCIFSKFVNSIPTAHIHTHYTVGGKCIHHQHIMDAGSTLREFDALK